MMIAWATIAQALSLTILTMVRVSAADDPNVANVVREVTGQLEKFNQLYITKLERELSTSSARLSALEATVRTIADRALAWDNIQNHMTVWTDQSRTMERKMDILNRCHEKQESWESKLAAVDALNHKLTALDKKINAMTRLEFKIEQVSERVEEVDSKLEWLRKQGGVMTSSPVGTEQQIAEFAGRGLLSSLIKVEHKLDNITSRMNHAFDTSYNRKNRMTNQRSRSYRPTLDPETTLGGKYDEQKHCRLARDDTRMLEDVSAKVDLMYDKITDPDYDYNNFIGQLPNVPMSSNTRITDDDNPSEHIFARFWKSLFAPFKKINRRFRLFENHLTNIHRACNDSVDTGVIPNDVGSQIQESLVPLDQLLRQGLDNTKGALSGHSKQLKKIAELLSSSAHIEQQIKSEINRQAQEQKTQFRDHFEDLRNMILQYCGSTRVLASDRGWAGAWRPTTTTSTSTRYPAVTTTTTTQAPTTTSKKRWMDCSDLVADGNSHSGVFELGPVDDLNDNGRNYYTRYCDLETEEGGWTVIQRRGMFGEPYLNFSLPWEDYKTGFGDLEREFWWGNDFMHRYSQEQELIIRFDLWDFEDNYAYAEYLTFGLGSEEDKYRLRVSGYRGNASDSFSAHNGYLFSTFDVDNDEAPDCCPCAPAYGGGWWFYSCFESNLNGEYHPQPMDNDYYRGLIWELWHGDYSLKATEIKLRPTKFFRGYRDSGYPTTYPDSYPSNTLLPENP